MFRIRKTVSNASRPIVFDVSSSGAILAPELRTVTQTEVVGYNTSTGELTVQAAGGGGSVATLTYGEMLDNTGNPITIPTSYSPDGWYTASSGVISGMTFLAGTQGAQPSYIRVANAGDYKVNFSLSANFTDVDDNIYVRLIVGGTGIAATEVVAFGARGTNQEISLTDLINLSANDVIGIQLKSDNNVTITPNLITFNITQLVGLGIAGTSGTSGTSGGGSSLRVRDNVTTVNNVDTITFPGDNVVTDDGSGDVTVTISGGGTPGGSDGQIQYNNGGAFGGDSGLTWDDSSDILSVKSTGANPSLRLSNGVPSTSAGTELAEIVGRSEVYSADVAALKFVADGTYSGGDYPTRIELQTTEDGGATLATKFQVKNDGQLIADEYGSGTFTGTATKFLAVDSSGNVIEEDAPSGGSTDYVSNITFDGSTLDLTGVGNATSNNVDLTTVTGTTASMNALVNSFDDIAYDVDSNSSEVIIGDSTPAGYSTIDEINGRTILINQSNTINGTLRFGFATWTERTSIQGRTARQDFKCEGFNIGQDDFNVGVYLPEGIWDIYQTGHQAGGGDRVAEYQVNINIGAGGAPRYFTRAMIEGSKFNVYYNYFHKKVVIWCSAWTGTGGATGAVTFSASDPN